MMLLNYKRRSWLVVFALYNIVGVYTAEASPTYSGSMSGIFSNPVTSGVLYLDGISKPVNNSSTTISSGFGTSAITWGDMSPSGLTFIGKAFSNVAPAQVFDFGTLVFGNGVNDLPSVIFGATLSLSAGGAITPLAENISIVNTQFTAGTVPSPAQAADWIALADFAPSTFNVFEGHTGSIELFGEIIGDPSVALAFQTLPPGQEVNGFIGTGFPVPEPSTLTLCGLAVMALVAFRTKRRVAGGRRDPD